ncbi:MAG TPA: hypothetical protein VMB03_10490 [Bryobacteraceae bacterium]|nr:hypothetical protein [Bryobacteraceae bacterium]
MRFFRQFLRLVLSMGCAAFLASAQQFTSGSTGADGAYSPTVSGDFDPVALGLDASGDNVFNFTTINIPAGVTIKLRASKLRNAAVTWLATGDVTIAGILDLSGASPVALNTAQPSQVAANRVLPEPGPGGYTGGLGSKAGVGAQAGAGPGGGPVPEHELAAYYSCYGGNASFITSGYLNGSFEIGAGPTYSSFLLVPLYGGSGGGGGWDTTTTSANVGGTGGAGGGAIRIVSATQINVTGTINANGGTGGTASGATAGCPGGAGAGGAIHLVAPAILGNGSLSANSGASNVNGVVVTNGIVRFSTNNSAFTGTATGGAILGPLFLPPANSTLATPSLSITQVNGVAVPPEAAGSYLNPDVIINSTGAVNVNLAAANIPLGTIVTLRITAETGADNTISCSPLAGSTASSIATCSATFPFSVSIAGVRASW